MLKHEQTDPPAVSPATLLPVTNAAEARVTPDELTAALKALEDRQSSTVAIGSVVDELRLNATAEEIWAQVEKQRAEAVAPKPQVQPVPVMQNPKIGRQVRRGWHQGKGWLWVIFWCTGGFGLLAGLPHLLHPQAAGQTMTISGDATTETVPVQGKDVVIDGDGDKITLQGQARSVIVQGDKDTLRGDAPLTYQSTGDSNDTQWNTGPVLEMNGKPLTHSAGTP